jgi:hypothetical protein
MLIEPNKSSYNNFFSFIFIKIKKKQQQKQQNTIKKIMESELIG